MMNYIGARIGLTFYLKPNWNKICQFDVSIFTIHDNILLLKLRELLSLSVFLRFGLLLHLKFDFVLNKFMQILKFSIKVTYSFRIGFGSLISYASFNKFKTNHLKLIVLH